MDYLLAGRHHVALRLVAVPTWVIFVSALTLPPVCHARRARRAAAQPAGPANPSGASRPS
jgi:hypothetical protein